MSEVIHYAYGQRYPTIREDGRRVEMVAIACQGTRVFLPKGHKAVHTDNGVNCRKCLEELIGHYKRSVEELTAAKESSIDDRTEFKLTRREKGRRLIEQWFKDRRQPDHETLERIRLEERP